jgi:hypothetical protein
MSAASSAICRTRTPFGGLRPLTRPTIAGQALAALPNEIRRAVREEVRRDLADTGGPIKAEAEYRIASGRR